MQIKLAELNRNNEDFYKKCWVDAMKYHTGYAENCGVTDKVCAYATEQQALQDIPACEKCFIIVSDGKEVGFIVYNEDTHWYQKPTRKVSFLYVIPAMRGNGIASKLKLDRIFCSLIQRVKDTLHYFNLDSEIPVCYESRITERDMGKYEKSSFDSLDWDSFWNYNSQIKYPDCESMCSTYYRVKQFLDELKQNNKNENILLVTHGGISRVIF